MRHSTRNPAFGQSAIGSVSAVSPADGREHRATYSDSGDKNYGRAQLGISSQPLAGLNLYLHGGTTLARKQRDSAVRLGLQYQF